MAANEIRLKDISYEVRVDGQRFGSSFGTIKNFSIKPDVEMPKKRFGGEDRARADLDIKGYGFSFKNEKRDHSWWTLWKKYEHAESNGLPFPDVTIAVTHRYRDGNGLLKTITLHGDLVLQLSQDEHPDSYQEVSWEGYCSFASGL